ncbi:MAG: glycerol kinase, partial [Lentisphaerae bacterium GWF2_52_8]
GMIREKTGLLLDPYFSATKLSWLLENIQEARVRAEKGELCWGTVDAWLLFKLTGQHRTDVSNASRTMLFNIKTGTWDKELLELFNIPKPLLPQLMPSCAEFGITRKELFGREIPVRAMLGDQQASLFGQACFKGSAWKNTYGTGCFMLAPTGRNLVYSKHKLLSTVAWDSGDGLEYALEGSVFIGGELIKWLRDQMGIIPDAASSSSMACSVPNSGGVYLVPAFAGLGAPYWDAEARGAILGLSGGTKRAHIARAALEAIAFQSAELFEAFATETGQPPSVLQADGGACANKFLMQFQADTLGIPVRTAANTETTAQGAAWMAGLGCGFWKNKEELSAQWKAGAEYEPGISDKERKNLLSRWRAAVAATRSYKPQKH